MWSLESLKKMDPYDFELLVGDLFQAMGYSTKVTPRSRDFGVDILIKLEHVGLSHSWIVQAKKYYGSVGVRDIREYGSLRVRDRVDGVIIVTTGYFTKDAVEEANQYNVKLISGDILVVMLDRYLERPLPVEANEVTENVHGDLLLHENEEILLREQVFMNGNRFELVLSSRNIFLKETGFLSKKTTLKHKIPVSDVIGAQEQKGGMLLFTGGENIRTCLIKGDEKIIEVLNRLKSSMFGNVEKLIKYSRVGERDIILTSKRFLSHGNGTDWQIPLYRISGVEIKNGLVFRNPKIALFVAGESMEQKEIAVDDARTWKSEIESAVRTCHRN